MTPAASPPLRLPLLGLLLAGCAAHPAVVPPVAPAPQIELPPPLPESVPATALEETRRGRELPPVAEVHGPLKITVVYPDSLARVDVEDSSFVFGSLGDGAATLRVNGDSVAVAPNGAWIAWIPFRGDSIITLKLEARSATDSARLEYHVRRALRYVPPASAALWIDSTSLSPVGRVWWPSDQYLALSVRASEGATLALRLPGGADVPFEADRVTDAIPERLRAFDRDTTKLHRDAHADRYRSLLHGAPLGDPGPLLGPGSAPPGGEPLLVAIKGRDTLKLRWPLRLALLDSVPLGVELDDDRDHHGGTDGITVGRAAPAATYTWFFPTGTRARVSGRVNGDLRIALSSRSDAWVSAAEAYPIPDAAMWPRVVESVTLSPGSDRVVARIPVAARVPFQILEEERALTVLLYGAVSDVNWLRYGPDDSLVTLATARQASADELELRFALSVPVWGYRAHWDGNDLLLEIRRPPVIDPAAPLRGRTITIDPGHPPLGATGPTGWTESEANLGIGLILRDLLLAEGARVLLTRSDARPIELWPRVRFSDSADAELLVSIHNNALPDGVNPFTNNGSSAFYNHVQALPLARAIQRRMVAQFGLRDLGVGRGDLALARPTWMPAVLTEGLFLMLPEQEAALRNPDGQRRYAVAVVEGIREFLRRRSLGIW